MAFYGQWQPATVAVCILRNIGRCSRSISDRHPIQRLSSRVIACRRFELAENDRYSLHDVPDGSECRLVCHRSRIDLAARLFGCNASRRGRIADGRSLFLSTFFNVASRLQQIDARHDTATSAATSDQLRRDVRDLQIPLPPIAEQDAIASILGALDDKIDLNRRMNETLEAMARAIFKDWFVDFGPTRAKMEGRAPYLAPEIWALFPDRLDDEGKPEGWETRPCLDPCELKRGYDLPSQDRVTGAIRNHVDQI